MSTRQNVLFLLGCLAESHTQTKKPDDDDNDANLAMISNRYQQVSVALKGFYFTQYNVSILSLMWNHTNNMTCGILKVSNDNYHNDKCPLIPVQTKDANKSNIQANTILEK